MRKALSLSAIFASLFFVSLTTVFAQSAEDNLVRAIENTIEDNYTAQTSVTGSFSVEEVEAVSGSVRVDTQKYKEDMYATANASVIITPYAFEAMGGDEDFSKDQTIRITAAEEAYFNSAENMFVYHLTDLGLSLKGFDAEVEEMIMGFFEMSKMFTNTPISFDLDTFAQIEDEEFQALMSWIENSLRSRPEIIGESLQIIFSANIFDVSQRGDTFTLTISEDTEAMEPQNLIELAKYIGLSEEEIEQEKEYFDEDDRAEFAAGIEETMKYMDFSLTVKKDRVKIDEIIMNMNINFDYPNYEYDYETYEITSTTVPVSVNFTLQSQIEDSAARISFPEKQGVMSFDRFFKAIWIMTERERREWEEWEQEWEEEQLELQEEMEDELEMEDFVEE